MNVQSAVQYHRESLGSGTDRFTSSRDGAPVTRARAIMSLRDDSEFRASFAATLAASRRLAFFFETPAWTSDSMARPFEFVLVDAPSLGAIRPDPAAFDAPLSSSSADVACFTNLGGDAELVVPREKTARDAYGHLAAFVRSAPPSQQHALLALLARSVLDRLSATPLWVSTAGLGVPWLHVRLDRRPKYYRHRPYAAWE